MFLHFKTWEVTEYFIEAAERPHLLLSQSDSLNFEAIVWSILMNQELRGPSCLMPCIRKDHHPCHVPLLPRWPRRTAPGMAPNRNRNAAKLAGSQIRLRRCCSDNFLPLQHLKPVIFNQIALGQAFIYKAPTSSSWEGFKTCSKSDLFVTAQIGTRGELMAVVGPIQWLVSSLSPSFWTMSAITALQNHPSCKSFSLFLRTEATLSARGFSLDLQRFHWASVVCKASLLEELPLSR